MKIKLGDLVRPNYNSYWTDVGIVTGIKRRKRAPTLIKIYWQRTKLRSPWMRPGMFKRIKGDSHPDGGRAL